MPPTNRLCPQCGIAIERIRDVPIFAAKRYCCADCAIDAWQDARFKGDARAQVANAARIFGRGTESSPEKHKP